MEDKSLDCKCPELIIGPQGPSGKDGRDGRDGRIGPRGERGFQGPIGLDGRDGLQGEQGEKGQKGNTGNNGIKGETGIMGFKGLSGEKGIKGDLGPKGMSIQGIKGEKGFVGRDIRSREIGRHPKYMLKDAKLFIRKYKASNGTEYFISFESKDNIALFGFCRLRIIHQKRNIHSVYDSTLYNMGLIRELHVYGSLVGVNQLMNTNMQAIQHNGIGKKLIHKAEQISFINHFKRGVVVISGIGVRGYYEKQGYFLRDNYMNKRFKYYNACLILVGILFGIIYDIIVTLITIYFTKKW